MKDLKLIIKTINRSRSILSEHSIQLDFLLQLSGDRMHIGFNSYSRSVLFCNLVYPSFTFLSFCVLTVCANDIQVQGLVVSLLRNN